MLSAPKLSPLHSITSFPTRRLAADEITEQFPTLALDFLMLKLLDRSEVSCAGVDRDAGQESFRRQTIDTGGLLHDIRAGKIVAAFFQNMDHRLSNTVAEQYKLVLTVILTEHAPSRGG
jgi:hypothetical protein